MIIFNRSIALSTCIRTEAIRRVSVTSFSFNWFSLLEKVEYSILLPGYQIFLNVKPSAKQNHPFQEAKVFHFFLSILCLIWDMAPENRFETKVIAPDGDIPTSPLYVLLFL